MSKSDLVEVEEVLACLSRGTAGEVACLEGGILVLDHEVICEGLGRVEGRRELSKKAFIKEDRVNPRAVLHR